MGNQLEHFFEHSNAMIHTAWTDMYLRYVIQYNDTCLDTMKVSLYLRNKYVCTFANN